MLSLYSADLTSREGINTAEIIIASVSLTSLEVTSDVNRHHLCASLNFSAGGTRVPFLKRLSDSEKTGAGGRQKVPINYKFRARSPVNPGATCQ